MSLNDIVHIFRIEGLFDDVYIKPYCRASPWIIGIFLGFFFFKFKKFTIENKVNIEKLN